MTRKVAKCGTLSGYARHRRLQELACAGCMEASRANSAAIRRARGVAARPPSVVKCGTRAGYTKHLRNDEPTCRPCKDANTAEYHRRRATTANVEQHRLYIAARGRALSRLAEAHPREYAALLADELGPDDVVVRQPWKWKAA